MEWLVKNNIYFIRVFTKSDKMKQGQILHVIEKYNNHMKTNHWEKVPESIVTSSVKRFGKDKILNKIIELNELFQNI